MAVDFLSIHNMGVALKNNKDKLVCIIHRKEKEKMSIKKDKLAWIFHGKKWKKYQS